MFWSDKDKTSLQKDHVKWFRVKDKGKKLWIPKKKSFFVISYSHFSEEVANPKIRMNKIDKSNLKK